MDAQNGQDAFKMRPRHCKICAYDATLPATLKGMNDENTGAYIGNPDWKVHNTANCEKNPLRGYICTLCWVFGHSAATCKIETTYGTDGSGGQYQEWYRLRRRNYWEMPTGVAFQKEYTAQTAANVVPPAPHECMAA